VAFAFQIPKSIELLLVARLATPTAHDLTAMTPEERKARLEAALDSCGDHAIDRDSARKQGDQAGMAAADQKIANDIDRMSTYADNPKDAAASKQLAQEYRQGDTRTRDKVLKCLKGSLLSGKLMGLAAVATLSVAAVGTPVLVLDANGKWIEGKAIQHDDGTTVLTDANQNGYVDTMQSFDLNGNALSASHDMGTGDAIKEFFSWIF
jgi:hypothetical protein